MIKRIRSGLFTAAILAGVGMATRGWAGPPFVTDDPEPVPYQHWEVYLAGQYAHERGGDAAAAPMFEVNYGALPDLQLHLVAPFILDAPSGESSHYGYGDTELGAKYRFIHETENIPQVGFFPLVEIPTGDEDRGLGNGKAQFFFPLWLQKSWDKWTSYGGGGWWLNPGEDNKDFWRAGWELQREISENVIVGGEIFYQSADSRGGEEKIAFNLGGIWNLDEHKHILFSAGRDFRGDTLFTCYLAVQITF